MMEVLSRIVICALLCQIALALEIINPDSSDSSQKMFTLKQNVGDSINLKCEAHYSGTESIVANPVKWHKTQKEEEKTTPAEGVEISNLASLSSDFHDLGRFALQYIPETNGINVAISGIKPEDSGYYFCFSTKDQVAYSITYKLEVQAEHTDIKLTGSSDEGNNATEEASLIFKDGDAGSVRCEATGGYPEATLRVFIEGEENPLTGNAETDLTLKGETVGMQTLSATSYVTIDSLIMRPDQNGKEIVCEIISQNNRIRASRVISVLFKPQIVECNDQVRAVEGDENVSFGCTFEANPAAETVKWSVRANSGIIEVPTDGKKVQDQYSASSIITDKPSQSGLTRYRTEFTIAEVKEDHFTMYELTIQSDDFQPITKEFVLERGQREEPDDKPVGGASFISLSSSCLLFSLAVLLFSAIRQ